MARSVAGSAIGCVTTFRGMRAHPASLVPRSRYRHDTRMDPSEAAKAFVTLIALVNPVGVAPIYLGLVSDRAPPERAAIARMAAMGVATIIGVSAVAGAAILSVFGIELASFRAAGGIILS